MTMPGPEEAFADTARVILELRGRGIGDLRLLEAIEEILRPAFAPERWAAAAASGEAVPLACGQSMNPVVDIATILDAARIQADYQVLLLGLGSGYSSAVAARLCASVTAGDRFRTLVAEASASLASQSIANVTCVQLDALSSESLPAGVFQVDRIVAFGAFPSLELPAFVTSALAPNGMMVAPVALAKGGILARFSRSGTGSPNYEILCPFYTQAFVPGLAREL